MRMFKGPEQYSKGTPKSLGLPCSKHGSDAFCNRASTLPAECWVGVHAGGGGGGDVDSSDYLGPQCES